MLAPLAVERLARLATVLAQAPIGVVAGLDKRDLIVLGDPALRQEIHAMLRDCRRWLIEQASRGPAPLYLDDASIDQHDAVAALRRAGLRAGVGLPLWTADGSPLGAVWVFDTSPRRWPQSVIESLVDLADCVAGKVALHAALIERERMEKVSLLNALSAHIALIDSAGTIVACNEAWQRFARENGGDDSSIGASYLEVCRRATGPDSEQAEQAHAGLLRVLGGETDLFQIEYPCHSPEQQRWFLMQATPLGGAQRGAVVAHIDITERKQAEAERAHLLARERQARAEAEAAVIVRDQFLATAAHDLKSPLAGIKAQAQLLRRRLDRGAPPNPAQMIVSLDRIDATATRMTRMIQDLLDVVRLQSDQGLDLQVAPTDVVAIARQVLDEQQEQTERHELRLVAAQPVVIGQWDGARLERVVRNLVANAVKYSPNGGAVTVTIERVGDHEARLMVEDAGIGIPAADLPHVFDGFRRASNVAGRISGTGIGLASARQIVEQHGGAICIQSEEGRGTRVTVSLPIAPASDVETGAAPPTEPA